jgi:UDP-GlcNAc:undecaprenyl-phosphate GlcNAc-1-phosphate transferase
VPDERKVHTGVVPRVGGIAMVIGAIVPMLLWVPMDQALSGLLTALAVLLLFGTWDDSRDLDYRLKFLGQLLAALIVVYVGYIKIAVFPFAGLDPVPDVVSIPITIVFLIGVTNAVNLSDGLDGLAAGIAFLSLCGVALLAYLADALDIVLMCFAVAGVVFGFLRYNTFPARVFMGDTGSQFLGFVIAVLAVALTQSVNTALNPLLPLFLVGLPIIDTFMVMYQRIRAGRSPFSPDKNHMHHQLLALGMKHYEAVSFIYLTQILFVVCGVLLRYESDLLVGAVYLLLCGSVLALMRFATSHDWKLKGSYVTDLMSRVDRHPGVARVATQVIGYGLAVYLLFGAVVPGRVSMDLVVSAAVLFVFLLVRLIWSQQLRFIPLRLLVFPAIAFIVYLLHHDAQAATVLPSDLRLALLVALILVMLVAVRYTRKEVFQTTPTDILVIALVGGVGVLYEHGIVDIELAPMVVELVLLFYAAELTMRQMKGAWNCLTIGVLGGLALLSARLVGW